MAKRHNIDTIAEVLIDKLSDMERTASRIEKASSKELKLDVSELRRLMDERKKDENAILSDLNAVKEKNKGRIPNWVLGVVLLSLLSSIVFSIYVWKKAEKYEFEKVKSAHFEKLYLDLKKEEK